MENVELLACFEDPNIMKAVHEIAVKPELIRTKYSKDARLQAFYRAMAGHVGEQLMGAAGHAAEPKR
jgi:hypothetical protein